MDSYITIREGATFEYEDRKSIFIGDVYPVEDESDALAFIDAVKRKYPDANHHVYAYVIRNNSIMRFSDDREPQGTAGMPVLDVIRKKGCTNIVAVVTRYFGGTLLGTGGLVRAYTAAAQGAIQNAGLITYDIYSEVKLVCSYSDYQKLLNVFAECGFVSENTRYAESIEITGKVVKTNLDSLFDKLVQATSGRIKTEIISEKYDFL